MIARRCLAVLWLAALLTSCQSSPPKRFFVLDAVPVKQPSTFSPSAAVQVAGVDIPPSLDRQEMVRESAPGSLEISDINRWGGPLADMMRDVLTRDLTERLPPDKVIPPRTSAPPSTYEVTVDLLQFGGDAKHNVVLNGGWSLYRLGSETPVLTRNVNFQEQEGAADYAFQAHAMSRLLGRLSDDIVQSLRNDVEPPKSKR